jgi:hypothetical protein
MESRQLDQRKTQWLVEGIDSGRVMCSSQTKDSEWGNSGSPKGNLQLLRTKGIDVSGSE